ncbi:putative NAD binding Rossmann fold oxidoreductase [Talaromyces proteolyticus]|uniref:NAD binding Rossmann fold oxidoreductase n=1 Tax=Talaromyces proteolyticus TaxID=1131652 RepID=A0AAD4KQM4_9EURO|nr:putative NAD binding Rossmann fold oxidoreductase [Talaromyces proteolyticus]KAH8694926.1 putative NAD binding Rossmann fold oxidoreductase [Talaromyces proteolyticus]
MADHQPSATTATTPAGKTAVRGTKKLKFLVIGAGSRGHRYSEAVTESTSAVIHAVAEPRPYNRQEFGESFIWGAGGRPTEGQEFSDWKDWLKWEQERRQKIAQGVANVPDGVDGVFVCVLDEMHVEVMCAIAPLNLHVLCEKPLATSMKDCLAIYRAFVPHGQEHVAPSKVFSIGHVMRYSPHNMRLRRLLLTDRVIGDIVSIEHTEPVGYWHFSHSYVRGNWRRETAEGVGSLLTKCSHDVDFLIWLLSSPPPGAPRDTPAHAPRTISSFGSLTQFRGKRKPKEAGSATNCVTCPIERKCNYSAVRIYRDRQLAKGDTEWPVDIVCPDIEDTFKTSGMAAAEKQLMEKLSEDYDKKSTPDEKIASRPWFGRCVWESDNNVCDDQFVTITWDDDENEATKDFPSRIAKTASLHMISPTERQCERRGWVYGTEGEIEYDSRTIKIFSFATQEFTTIEIPKAANPREEIGHGGGDWGLARMYVGAIDAVENEGWDVRDAQNHFIGCTLEEAVRSHALVFAAEEARREEKVIKWQQWWDEKMKSHIAV